jgi:hypothetical protein
MHQDTEFAEAPYTMFGDFLWRIDYKNFAIYIFGVSNRG